MSLKLLEKLEVEKAKNEIPWRDHIFQLAWECLGMPPPQNELAGEGASFVGTLPPQLRLEWMVEK